MHASSMLLSVNVGMHASRKETEIMDTKKCILNYAQKQTPKDLSTLSFTVIKTDSQFRKAYAMHDAATTYVVQQYLQRKYHIHPLGVDLRKHEVIIEEELPDYIAEKEDHIFCYDTKAKSSVRYFGWVNERAILSYRKLAETCEVPIYLIFIRVTSGNVEGEAFCNVQDEPIGKKRAWNGNVVWIFPWKKGFPHI